MAAATPNGENPASRWVASVAPAVLWTAIGCPFDVIKTRLQTASPPFASPLCCLAWTVRREGVQTLWKGTVPLLVTSAPYSVIMFGTYQSLKPSKQTHSGVAETSGYIGRCFLAGAASGVAVTAVHNPLELWRVRVQTHLPLSGSSDNRKARTTGSVLRSLLAQPWQLGRGASMTLAENIIGNGVFFGSNEALRMLAPDRSWTAELLMGGLTGLIFQLVVYPADLVKARLMTQDGTHATQVARRILSAEGVGGFYRGASVALLRGFAINAAGWPALRVAQWWLGVPA